jgi:uncharacterized protein (UPF0147 family)
MVYNRYMKHNEENVIVENVLTEEELSLVYSKVNQSSSKYVMKLFAQTVSDFDLPEVVRKKIIAYSEKISGENNLEIAEYQFARYKKVLDDDSKQPLLPKLIPHWDAAFEEPRFTFDYQIGGNTTWPIVVEEKEFTLKNNSALTFSGTHQIHWRTPKSFDDNEYLDMVFFHLRKIKAEKIPNNLKTVMKKKLDSYSALYKEGDARATN